LFSLPIAESRGGGGRVRAARLRDPSDPGGAVTPEACETAAAAMRALGQPELFLVLDRQTALDDLLAAQGYRAKDPTLILAMPSAALAKAPPPVTCFETWPPLGIQHEIWAQAGIGADRRAVMQRAKGPKVSLFGRINDKPAGTAFVAIHDHVAMLHTLEILPTARRQGLAGHMMRAAAHWALENGADRISVLVTRENEIARSLYASLGFEAVGHYQYRAKTV